MSNLDSSFPPTSLQPILTELTTLLEASPTPVKIAVAETSTGGLISAALLSIPGASKWYAGGTTLYTRDSRMIWGGWREENLKDYRGPTEEIVTGLATHVCTSLGATYCIGESGTAGPTAPGKPFVHSIIGTVSLAVVSTTGEVISRTVATGLGNDRSGNMVAFAAEALKLLRDVLNGSAKLEKSVGGKEDGSVRL